MEMKRRVLNSAECEAYKLAEESLLGAILVDASDGNDNRDTINAIALIVKPSDFMGFDERYPVNQYQCRNGRIYSAMLSCKGSPHIVNVSTEITSRGLINPGDNAHMSHCTAEVPNSYDWEDYAVSVRYFSQLRKSVESGQTAPKIQQIKGGVTIDL